MTLVKNLLAATILWLFSFQSLSQKAEISIEVSTPNSFLVVNNDTIEVIDKGIKKLMLSLGKHEIKNIKEAFCSKRETVIINNGYNSIKFSELIKVPLLDESKNKIILNKFAFHSLKSTSTKSYTSKSRFLASSSKFKSYTTNLEERFDPFSQERMIKRGMREHDLVEDQETNGFTITENNVNLDIEITSVCMDQFRVEMERYTFECTFKLLDLKLTPIDSATFFCIVDNEYGQIEPEALNDELIEKLYSYIDEVSWKGILDRDRSQKRENKKFDFNSTQNVFSHIEARKAVVTIITENGHGSGCLVSSSGLVVTNAHVIKGSESVEVITFFGDTIKGEVADYNPTADLAIVQLNDSVEYVFEITKSDQPIEIGKRVFAIGSPLSPELSQSISDGIVSTELRLNGVEYIQTDAKVNGGNSGGALVDKSGRLLGIVNAKIVDFSVEGISFAIPVSEVLIHFARYE